jgi:hypothetical protein
MLDDLLIVIVGSFHFGEVIFFFCMPYFCYALPPLTAQMNYWLASSTNLLECEEPLVDFTESFVLRGTQAAQHYYARQDGSDVRGWCAHHENNIWVWIHSGCAYFVCEICIAFVICEGPSSTERLLLGILFPRGRSVVVRDYLGMHIFVVFWLYFSNLLFYYFFTNFIYSFFVYRTTISSLRTWPF